MYSLGFYSSQKFCIITQILHLFHYLCFFYSVTLISHILWFLILSYISLKCSLILFIVLTLSDSLWLISYIFFHFQNSLFDYVLSTVNQFIEYINFKMLTIIYLISNSYLHYQVYYQISLQFSDSISFIFNFKISSCVFFKYFKHKFLNI